MITRRRLAALTSSALAALALGAGSAAAATPGEVTSFEVASPCYGDSIAAAPREGVILRQCEEPKYDVDRAPLGNLLPSGQIVPLATIEARAGPMLAGPSGELWVATNKAGFSKEPVGIDRIDPDGSIQSFAVPAVSGAGLNPEAIVRGLAIGPEGALWAAVGEGGSHALEWYSSPGGELVRIDPDGSKKVFRVPDSIEPFGIATGPDGNLWFTGVRGVASTEHSFFAGVGYIGRMTPTGGLTLFRTPVRRADPEAIAAGPEGNLWFTMARTDQIGTVGVDGKFGRQYDTGNGPPPRGLVFGPEGDAWTLLGSLARITPAGQETLFEADDGTPVVGADGDIWTDGYDEVFRLVPGAPGIDVQSLKAHRGARTVSVRLACGGSASGCEGTLELALETPRRYRRQHRHLAGNGTFPFAQVPYEVAAESSSTLTIGVPARAFSIASLYRPSSAQRELTVDAKATVAGGPPLKREIAVPSFAQAGSAASATK